MQKKERKLINPNLVSKERQLQIQQAVKAAVATRSSNKDKITTHNKASAKLKKTSR